MELDEAMRTLESLGTAQNRKVYGRHGVREPMYGVSYANLGSLRKQIKVDHALAQALWATGNHDARVLATMIADPKQANTDLLESWAADLDGHVLADALVEYAARTPQAQAQAERWLQAPIEPVRRAGWHLLARLNLSDPSKESAYFLPYLDLIQAGIHAAPNREREGMNNALIAIGGRNSLLKERALEVARVIGKVQIDHGQTDCKTPDAAVYIQKIHDRKK